MAKNWANKFGQTISLGALIAASGAYAQDTAEVEVRAGAVASTSPFLFSEEDSSSVAASVEVLPRLAWRGETSSLVLDGSLRYEEWLKDYGSNLSGDVGLSVTKQASETLELFGSASFQSFERSSPDLLLGNIEEVDTAPLLDADVTTLDPTVGLGATRRNSANATVGFRADLSSVSQISTSLISEMNWFDETGFDYRATSLAAEYQQVVAPNLSWLLEVSGGVSDYLDQVRGDGTFGSVMTGFSTQVSPTGVLSATAGITIADIDTGLGTSDRGEFFVAQIDFCEDLLEGKACLGASRQTRPTTIGGASTLTSVDFGWNRAFDEGESLSLNVRYSQAKATLAALDADNFRNTKFIGASATYTYPIADRFGLYVSPSVLKLFDDEFDRGTNYQVAFGLSYTFGR